jgi:hypothetical protein
MGREAVLGILLYIISSFSVVNSPLPGLRIQPIPIPHQTNISCWINGSSIKDKVVIINGTLNCFFITTTPYQCVQSFDRAIQEVVWIKHRFCHVSEIAINSITIHCSCGTSIASYHNLSEIIDLSLGEIYIFSPTYQSPTIWSPSEVPAATNGVFLTWKNLTLALIPFVVLIISQVACTIFCLKCYWCKTDPDPEPPEEREEIEILTGA